ncbi:hypothetical protein Pvag_pPag20127 (plasmid) [Pantoea vagans C9-1]|nr:hypothetical protein Pvag_pPag20127 [Pantoea vagans C9-1]
MASPAYAAAFRLRDGRDFCAPGLIEAVPFLLCHACHSPFV